MRRPDPTLDPLVVEELERLDAALAGSPDADPGLEALVRDVRAEAPEMAPAFRGELDARVRAGFPRARRFAWRPSRMLLVPALGAAATLLIAVVVIGLAGGGGGAGGGAGDSASGGAGTVSGAAPNAGAPPPTATAESATPQKSAPPAPPLNGGASGRKVERAAQLTLTTAPDDVQDVADGVIRTAAALDGYVETSQISSGDEGGGASLRLRVPSARLDETIARLGDLAHVGSLTRASTDITAPVASVTARLSDARAERRALLRALGKATTDREIASLRERLRLNRSQIAALKGELAGLRRRANLATVDVTVQGTGRKAGGGTGAWTPKDALHDALRVLEVAAGVVLVAGAVLLPLALLAAVVGLAARSRRRRRRDAALDAA